ncbi:MAG: alpha/beta hydrolase [Aquificae bacterium]|nr:alpha/beta hydrolase [Aquificota bacterium]
MNIFIHGWGFSKEVWKDFFCLEDSVFLDLPYHNSNKNLYKSDILRTFSYEVSSLIESSNKKVNVIGWSLGASIAVLSVLEIDQQRINDLVLVGFTPKFLDKSLGHNPILVKAFLLGLKIDFEKTVFSFRETAVGDRFDNIPLPSKEGSIEVLKEYINLDLKEKIKDIKARTTFIHGKQDKIVSINGSIYANQFLENSTLQVVDSHHAPFLDNPQLILEIVSR